MTGRKPKPTHIRVIEGLRGHRPINEDEPKPTPIYPEPSSFLDSIAQDEWRRIVPDLFKLGIMTTLDIVALEGYCYYYSQWRQELIDGTPNRAMNYFKLMARMLTEFGMSPASRTRIRATRTLTTTSVAQSPCPVVTRWSAPGGTTTTATARVPRTCSTAATAPGMKC